MSIEYPYGLLWFFSENSANKYNSINGKVLIPLRSFVFLPDFSIGGSGKPIDKHSILVSNLLRLKYPTRPIIQCLIRSPESDYTRLTLQREARKGGRYPSPIDTNISQILCWGDPVLDLNIWCSRRGSTSHPSDPNEGRNSLNNSNTPQFLAFISNLGHLLCLICLLSCNL